jgi:hypothetical protein
MQLVLLVSQSKTGTIEAWEFWSFSGLVIQVNKDGWVNSTGMIGDTVP